MKNVFYLMLMTMFMTSCNKMNCQKYHSGNFSMEIENINVEVFRDKEYQYEYYGKDSVKYKITWLNDCKYNLKLIETSINKDLELLDTLISTKITRTYSYGYEFESVGNSTEVPIKGTMKIK
jgi:hypothetical protein